MRLLHTKMKTATFMAGVHRYKPLLQFSHVLGQALSCSAQDMKCCIIWHLEALRRLKKSGVKFSRTLYITAVPGKTFISLSTTVLNLCCMYILF